jgi:hypothetical protein
MEQGVQGVRKMVGRVFDVVVHNELTHEETTVRLTSGCSQDAQVEALVQVFKSRGWRKISALPPIPVLPSRRKGKALHSSGFAAAAK